MLQHGGQRLQNLHPALTWLGPFAAFACLSSFDNRLGGIAVSCVVGALGHRVGTMGFDSKVTADGSPSEGAHSDNKRCTELILAHTYAGFLLGRTPDWVGQ